MPDPAPIDKDEPVAPDPFSRRAAALSSIEDARTDMLRDAGMDIPEAEPTADKPSAPKLEPAPEAPEDRPPPAPDAETGAAPDSESTTPESEPGPEAGASQEEPPQAPPSGDEPETTYKVLVDGKEQEITLSELTRSYQINGAAEGRLNMASDVLRRVEKIQDDLKAGKTPDETEPKKPTDDPKKVSLEGIDFKAVAERLQYASPDEAAESLQGLVSQVLEQAGGGAAAPNQAEVTRAVMDEVNFRSAVTRFGQDYSDIAGDEQLSVIAGNRSHQIYQHYQKWSQETGSPMPDYWSIMKMAGDDTRTWAKDTLGKLAPPLDSETPAQDDTPSTDPTPSAKDARLDRKRSATQPPRAQGTPASNLPKAPPKEESEIDRRRDAIKTMAKSRGQSI